MKAGGMELSEALIVLSAILGIILIIVLVRLEIHRRSRLWQEVSVTDWPSWVWEGFPRRISKHNNYIFRGKHWLYRVAVIRDAFPPGGGHPAPTHEYLHRVEKRLRRRFW